MAKRDCEKVFREAMDRRDYSLAAAAVEIGGLSPDLAKEVRERAIEAGDLDAEREFHEKEIAGETFTGEGFSVPIEPSYNDDGLD